MYIMALINRLNQLNWAEYRSEEDRETALLTDRETKDAIRPGFVDVQRATRVEAGAPAGINKPSLWDIGSAADIDKSIIKSSNIIDAKTESAKNTFNEFFKTKNVQILNPSRPIISGRTEIYIAEKMVDRDEKHSVEIDMTLWIDEIQNNPVLSSYITFTDVKINAGNLQTAISDYQAEEVAYNAEVNDFNAKATELEAEKAAIVWVDETPENIQAFNQKANIFNSSVQALNKRGADLKQKSDKIISDIKLVTTAFDKANAENQQKLDKLQGSLNDFYKKLFSSQSFKDFRAKSNNPSPSEIETFIQSEINKISDKYSKEAANIVLSSILSQLESKKSDIKYGTETPNGYSYDPILNIVNPDLEGARAKAKIEGNYATYVDEYYRWQIDQKDVKRKSVSPQERKAYWSLVTPSGAFNQGSKEWWYSNISSTVKGKGFEKQNSDVEIYEKPNKGKIKVVHNGEQSMLYAELWKSSVETFTLLSQNEINEVITTNNLDTKYKTGYEFYRYSQDGKKLFNKYDRNLYIIPNGTYNVSIENHLDFINILEADKPFAVLQQINNWIEFWWDKEISLSDTDIDATIQTIQKSGDWHKINWAWSIEIIKNALSTLRDQTVAAGKPLSYSNLANEILNNKKLQDIIIGTESSKDKIAPQAWTANVAVFQALFLGMSNFENDLKDVALYDLLDKVDETKAFMMSRGDLTSDGIYYYKDKKDSKWKVISSQRIPIGALNDANTYKDQKGIIEEKNSKWVRVAKKNSTLRDMIGLSTAYANYTKSKNNPKKSNINKWTDCDGKWWPWTYFNLPRTKPREKIILEWERIHHSTTIEVKINWTLIPESQNLEIKPDLKQAREVTPLTMEQGTFTSPLSRGFQLYTPETIETNPELVKNNWWVKEALLNMLKRNSARYDYLGSLWNENHNLELSGNTWVESLNPLKTWARSEVNKGNALLWAEQYVWENDPAMMNLLGKVIEWIPEDELEQSLKALFTLLHTGYQSGEYLTTYDLKKELPWLYDILKWNSRIKVKEDYSDFASLATEASKLGVTFQPLLDSDGNPLLDSDGNPEQDIDNPIKDPGLAPANLKISKTATGYNMTYETLQSIADLHNLQNLYEQVVNSNAGSHQDAMKWTLYSQRYMQMLMKMLWWASLEGIIQSYHAMPLDKDKIKERKLKLFDYKNAPTYPNIAQLQTLCMRGDDDRDKAREMATQTVARFELVTEWLATTAPRDTAPDYDKVRFLSSDLNLDGRKIVDDFDGTRGGGQIAAIFMQAADMYDLMWPYKDQLWWLTPQQKVLSNLSKYIRQSYASSTVLPAYTKNPTSAYELKLDSFDLPAEDGSDFYAWMSSNAYHTKLVQRVLTTSPYDPMYILTSGEKADQKAVERQFTMDEKGKSLSEILSDTDKQAIDDAIMKSMIEHGFYDTKGNPVGPEWTWFSEHKALIWVQAAGLLISTFGLTKDPQTWEWSSYKLTSVSTQSNKIDEKTGEPIRKTNPDGTVVRDADGNLVAEDFEMVTKHAVYGVGAASSFTLTEFLDINVDLNIGLAASTAWFAPMIGLGLNKRFQKELWDFKIWASAYANTTFLSPIVRWWWLDFWYDLWNSKSDVAYSSKHYLEVAGNITMVWFLPTYGVSLGRHEDAQAGLETGYKKLESEIDGLLETALTAATTTSETVTPAPDDTVIEALHTLYPNSDPKDLETISNKVKDMIATFPWYKSMTDIQQAQARQLIRRAFLLSTHNDMNKYLEEKGRELTWANIGVQFVAGVVTLPSFSFNFTKYWNAQAFDTALSRAEEEYSLRGVEWEKVSESMDQATVDYMNRSLQDMYGVDKLPDSLKFSLVNPGDPDSKNTGGKAALVIPVHLFSNLNNIANIYIDEGMRWAGRSNWIWRLEDKIIKEPEMIFKSEDTEQPDMAKIYVPTTVQFGIKRWDRLNGSTFSLLIWSNTLGWTHLNNINQLLPEETVDKDWKKTYKSKSWSEFETFSSSPSSETVTETVEILDEITDKLVFDNSALSSLGLLPEQMKDKMKFFKYLSGLDKKAPKQYKAFTSSPSHSTLEALFSFDKEYPADKKAILDAIQAGDKVTQDQILDNMMQLFARVETTKIDNWKNLTQTIKNHQKNPLLKKIDQTGLLTSSDVTEAMLRKIDKNGKYSRKTDPSVIWFSAFYTPQIGAGAGMYMTSLWGTDLLEEKDREIFLEVDIASELPSKLNTAKSRLFQASTGAGWVPEGWALFSPVNHAERDVVRNQVASYLSLDSSLIDDNTLRGLLMWESRTLWGKTYTVNVSPILYLLWDCANESIWFRVLWATISKTNKPTPTTTPATPWVYQLHTATQVESAIDTFNRNVGVSIVGRGETQHEEVAPSGEWDNIIE